MLCLAVISKPPPPIEGQSTFSRPVVLTFLKGLISEFPPILVSPLDLNLIVSVLMDPPFKLMAILCSLAIVSENVIQGIYHLGEEGSRESSLAGWPSFIES